jgi:hypothetical protein
MSAFSNTQIQRILDSFSVGTLLNLEHKDISRPDKTIDAEAIVVETTHDNYLLFGLPHIENKVSQSDVLDILARKFNITICTFMKTDQKLQITHQFDHYWFLVKPNQELTESEVQDKLSQLRNVDVATEMGYGGVLFVNIGNLIQLYSNEFWEIKLGEKKLADRWSTNADLVKQLGPHTIESISFVEGTKQTHIKLSTGHVLVIYRQDELRTWEINHNQERYSIILLGTGKFLITDYKPKEETHPKNSKHQLLDPAIKQFYKEDIPLSSTIVSKLLKQIVGTKIGGVFQHSAIGFTIDMSSTWRFSVYCNWRLVDDKGKSSVDSTTNRFAFMDSLLKLLIGVEVKELIFSENLRETQLVFNNGLLLLLPKEKRHHLWTISNHTEGYHIDALGDGTFRHTILVPDELKDKYRYTGKGSNFTDILYALDLYRKWVQP